MTQDRQIIESVAAQLSRVEHFDGFSFISTPLLFPNGGQVLVRVEQTADGSFFVSDHGIGADESEMIDGLVIYSRLAREVAKVAGIGFDQQSFFILRASEGKLAGAITTVANAVQEAVVQTYNKVEHVRAKKASDKMFNKLTNIFDAKYVAKDVVILGASNHSWPFDGQVKIRDKVVLFDSVSNHHNSVVSAVAKFYDVARSDISPTRVAVVEHPDSMGDLLSLLTQTADVIELNAPESSYKRLAA